MRFLSFYLFSCCFFLFSFFEFLLVFLRFVLKYVRQMIRSQTLKIISKKQNCNSSGRANHPQTIYRFRDDSNARNSYNFNIFFQPDKNTLNQATLRLVSLRLSLIFWVFEWESYFSFEFLLQKWLFLSLAREGFC